jgi:hypothetical protein
LLYTKLMMGQKLDSRPGTVAVADHERYRESHRTQMHLLGRVGRLSEEGSNALYPK